MQMTYTEIADPAVFLADLGEGKGERRNKGSRKTKRAPGPLTSFQAPRYRQGQLNFRGEGPGREHEEEGREGGEGGEEGERRGQAKPRTSIHGNRDRGKWGGVQSRIQAQGEIGTIGIINLSGIRLAATIAELWRGGRGGVGESGAQGGGGG